MLEGICHECGLHYHGLALKSPGNQLCIKCGSSLEVRNDGQILWTAFPPFRTRKYRVSADQEEWEDLCGQNLLFHLRMN